MSKKILYFSQLDSLRALAVIMTLLVHFLPESRLFIKIPYMQLGVDLFFAISGFLITSILLKTRIDSSRQNRFLIIKNFIIRRTLRLFPIFYIFLISFVLFSAITGFWLWNKGLGIYYFTYTANFLFYFKDYQSPCFNHIWSLCVEEQFYLFWPWLMLFLPIRWVEKTLYLFIFMGIISYMFFNNSNIRMLPIGNFHTLGAGALLGFLWYHKRESNYVNHLLKFSKKYFLLVFVLFLSLLIYMTNFSAPSQINIYIVALREFLLAVVLFLLLLSTISGWNGFIGAAANNHFIQNIGKISYGIYLFHKPIPTLTNLVLKKTWMFNYPAFLFVIYILITFLIATISYRYIETPFLKLKEKFDS